MKVLFAVSLMFVGGLAATAQSSDHRESVYLAGHIDDGHGAFIPGAEVSIRAPQVLDSAVKSDENGNFQFNGPEGAYDITIKSQGFFVVHKQAVFLANVASNFSLTIASGGGVEVEPNPQFAQKQVPNAPEASPVSRFANSMPWEYGVLVQGGNGLTEDRNGFHFMSAGVHLGKVLTPESGHGMLKGNFEYAVEVYPFWQSYTPKFQKASCFAVPTAGTSFLGPGLYCSPLYTVGGTFTGATITPIILRWNFTHGKKLMPWAQAAGGLLWTNHKYPAFGSSVLNLQNDGPNSDASVFNFTPQGGIGMHYFVKPTRSLDFSANAVHISSASLGDKNPGVNASVQFTLGYTWWK